MFGLKDLMFLGFILSGFGFIFGSLLCVDRIVDFFVMRIMGIAWAELFYFIFLKAQMHWFSSLVVEVHPPSFLVQHLAFPKVVVIAL